MAADELTTADDDHRRVLSAGRLLWTRHHGETQAVSAETATRHLQCGDNWPEPMDCTGGWCHCLHRPLSIEIWHCQWMSLKLSDSRV